MTSATRPDRANGETNEQLVAYLDGELSPEQAAEVERRLANDPEYRGRLEALRRTWQLLDDLPRTQSSPELTRSTVTMVAQTVSQRRRRDAVWRPWAFGAVTVLAVSLLSFWTASRRLNADDERFLRDLPVIQNVDIYRHVEDVEFLRQLIDDGLIVDDPVDGEEPDA